MRFKGILIHFRCNFLIFPLHYLITLLPALEEDKYDQETVREHLHTVVCRGGACLLPRGPAHHKGL